MTLPVLSAVILKAVPHRGSAVISLFVNQGKWEPRQMTSFTQSRTAWSGSPEISPRLSDSSGHPPNHHATCHVTLVFCLISIFLSGSLSLLMAVMAVSMSLFSLCRPGIWIQVNWMISIDVICLGLSSLLCKMQILEDYSIGLSWEFHDFTQTSNKQKL